MKLSIQKTENIETDVDLTVPKCFVFGDDEKIIKFEEENGKPKVTVATFISIAIFELTVRNTIYPHEVSVLEGKGKYWAECTEEHFNNVLFKKLHENGFTKKPELKGGTLYLSPENELLAENELEEQLKLDALTHQQR